MSHLEAWITKSDFQSIVVSQRISAIVNIFSSYKGQAVFDLCEFGFAALTNTIAIENPSSVTKPCPFPSLWDMKIGVITNRREYCLFTSLPGLSAGLHPFE